NGQSIVQTVLARTRTSTSPSLGAGFSTSSIFRTSGDPYRLKTAAFMLRPSFPLREKRQTESDERQREDHQVDRKPHRHGAAPLDRLQQKKGPAAQLYEQQHEIHEGNHRAIADQNDHALERKNQDVKAEEREQRQYGACA